MLQGIFYLLLISSCIHLSIKYYACSIAIIKYRRIIRCIYRIMSPNRYWFENESSDVPSDWNTTDIGRLIIRKQQSTQFCQKIKLKQTHKTLNDGWSIELNTKT
jgi:hypothetical protein